MKILKINDVLHCAARAQGVFQQPAKAPLLLFYINREIYKFAVNLSETTYCCLADGNHVVI